MINRVLVECWALGMGKLINSCLFPSAADN
jgi:hypothetical protein